MSQRSIDELPLGVAKGDSLVPFADPATGIAYKISIKEFMLAGTSDDAGSVRAPVFLSSPVNTVADLPAVGLPGQLVIVLDKKSIYGWDDITGTWVNGGNIQGPAGETLKIQKSVDHANHLDAAPPLLTVTLVTHTKTLFIFDPTNAAAATGPATPLVPASPGVAEVPANPPAGWVALGRIEGPPGPKGDKGDPGLVKGTVEGQILRWSVADDKWVGGSAPVVTPNGNANGDTLKWNGALNRWDSVGLGDVLPTATSNQILVFDGTANTWAGTSDLLDIGALSFTANTGGEMADQIVAGDFSLVPPADVAEDTSLVTVSAVRGYVDDELRLENVSDCKELATAEDGMVPVWNGTNNRWVPAHITSPIVFMGTGAHDPGNVASAAARYGMPADTHPDPLVFHALPGDQYIDLSTGNITVFTGTTGTGTRDTGSSDITVDLSPPMNISASSGTLQGLSDCDIVMPKDGDVLTYYASAQKWFPKRPAALSIASTDITDFNLTNPQDGDMLRFNGTTWENSRLASVAGYTRTEVDDKISALAKGMSHGEAVMSFLNAPPASPAQYQLHIVGTSPSGAFAGHANELAEWDGAAWVFSTARSGESHLLEDSGQTWHWNGTAWVKVGAVALPAWQPYPRDVNGDIAISSLVWQDTPETFGVYKFCGYVGQVCQPRVHLRHTNGHGDLAAATAVTLRVEGGNFSTTYSQTSGYTGNGWVFYLDRNDEGNKFAAGSAFSGEVIVQRKDPNSDMIMDFKFNYVRKENSSQALMDTRVVVSQLSTGGGDLLLGWGLSFDNNHVKILSIVRIA